MMLTPEQIEDARWTADVMRSAIGNPEVHLSEASIEHLADQCTELCAHITALEAEKKAVEGKLTKVRELRDRIKDKGLLDSVCDELTQILGDGK